MSINNKIMYICGREKGGLKNILTYQTCLTSEVKFMKFTFDIDIQYISCILGSIKQYRIYPEIQINYRVTE